MKNTPRENPEIEPVPHTEPLIPAQPEIIPGPEKTEPVQPVPETQPIRQPEISPNKE